MHGKSADESGGGRFGGAEGANPGGGFAENFDFSEFFGFDDEDFALVFGDFFEFSPGDKAEVGELDAVFSESGGGLSEVEVKC